MSRSSFTHDVIIIGQGLAGVVLSETLTARGLRVQIFDAPLEGRASAVAAGMVNPLVFRRTLLSWRASEMLAIAGAFYRDLQLEYEASLWHPLPLIELFPTAQEAGIWQLRMKDPEMERFLGLGTSTDPAIQAMSQPYGHGEVKRCAWLDVRAMLAIHRKRAVASLSLDERKVEEADIIRSTDGVEVFGRSAPLLVYCAGPFAQGPGMVPVRGEGLTVRIPGLNLGSMLHRGVFVIPIGNDLYRIGSTFAWDDVWSGPTAEARRWLLQQLERSIPEPVEVVDHWVGVRPASRDRRPILGRVGSHEAVFNGLGSRGVLLAPWSAQHLADHLLKGTPVDPEVDPARFNP